MPPRDKYIIAVMAVHNRLSLTQRCISCLRSTAYDGVCLSIVVVDDGSTDGTREWLEQQPDVTRLCGDGSLWFGGATDLALRHLIDCSEKGPDSILLLNNDTFLRPEALKAMISVSTSRTVVATAFWTEDKMELCTTGYVWKSWRGLVDVSRCNIWPLGPGSQRTVVSVDAISTTVVLVPFGLLLKSELPDAHLHPHNRYDAILSARLRDAGGVFLCVVDILADHEYGAAQARPTVRTLGLHRFWIESFWDRRSIWHLKGGLALAWESAPNLIQAVWACNVRIVRFLRQLSWVLLKSFFPRKVVPQMRRIVG